MSRFGKPEKTTEHRYFEERLSAYLDGELRSHEQDAVERHLSTCQACRWNLETLSKTVQWTRELPTVPIPRVFTIQVPAAPQRATRRRWSFVPALQAATAVVALLLFFTVTGDFLLGGFRMAGTPDLMRKEQQLSVAVEATQEVELAQEAPAAVTEAVEAMIVETVVVEAEAPAEAQAEKQVIEQTSAPLPTHAPEPAPPAEGEVARDVMPAEPVMGGPEGESQAEEFGLTTAPSPTLEIEAPMAAGGEAEPRALTAPAGVTAQPTALAAAAIEELEPADRAADRLPARSLQQPVSLGLRLIEYALGMLFLLLAATTLVAMVQRHRSRSG
jgi:anti-sigma factor RsiW